MTTQELRIFVSHSSKDHDFCLRIVYDLQEVLGDEKAVWYDAQGGLQGGDTWWRKIVQELETRNLFLVVLSPDAISSDWVNDEIDIAWRQKNSPARMRIFPLLYRICDVRTDLENFQIISFLPPKTYEEAFNELLDALNLPPSKRKRAIRNQSTRTISIRKTKEQWIFEGLAFGTLKRYEEAIAAYDQAIRLDPLYAIAYFNKGLALDHLGKHREAQQAFRRARQLGYERL